MRQKTDRHQDAAERTIKDIRRQTRKRYSSEEKIRIVLAGLRGEDSIAELCRQEGIAQGMYYSWSKEFLEAGKKRLAGDTARDANTGEVKAIRQEARDLKEVVAEQALELRLLNKSRIGDGEDIERDIPHRRSLRSSGWLSNQACQSGGHWTSWGSPARPSIAGMISTKPAAWTRWRTSLRGQSVCGTVFPMR